MLDHHNGRAPLLVESDIDAGDVLLPFGIHAGDGLVEEENLGFIAMARASSTYLR